MEKGSLSYPWSTILNLAMIRLGFLWTFSKWHYFHLPGAPSTYRAIPWMESSAVLRARPFPEQVLLSFYRILFEGIITCGWRKKFSKHLSSVSATSCDVIRFFFNYQNLFVIESFRWVWYSNFFTLYTFQTCSLFYKSMHGFLIKNI